MKIMARYIDADILIERLKFKRDETDKVKKKYSGLECAISQVQKQPTADVVKVKQGEWIYNTDEFSPKMRCSVCGYNKPIVSGENIKQEPDNYCSKCGSKMKGGERI